MLFWLEDLNEDISQHVDEAYDLFSLTSEVQKEPINLIQRLAETELKNISGIVVDIQIVGVSDFNFFGVDSSDTRNGLVCGLVFLDRLLRPLTFDNIKNEQVRQLVSNLHKVPILVFTSVNVGNDKIKTAVQELAKRSKSLGYGDIQFISKEQPDSKSELYEWFKTVSDEPSNS